MEAAALTTGVHSGSAPGSARVCGLVVDAEVGQEAGVVHEAGLQSVALIYISATARSQPPAGYVSGDSLSQMHCLACLHVQGSFQRHQLTSTVRSSFAADAVVGDGSSSRSDQLAPLIQCSGLAEASKLARKSLAVPRRDSANQSSSCAQGFFLSYLLVMF